MRKPNPQTHQACRSLLQKAVRRGSISLTRKIARHLQSIGDADWLKTRTAIITFEECWPLGTNLHLKTDFEGILDTLTEVTRTVKVKDATGLGVLAYEFSDGDTSVLFGTPEDQHIRRVAEAIINPQDFWTWATQNCSQMNQQALIQSSMKAYRRGGWPWDRALIQAAAYLAMTNGIPEVHLTRRPSVEVPFWVGLDKHTSQGKKALQDTARNIGVPARQLSWISFYFESARANESTESYWWLRERQWRLSKVGVDQDKASLIWERAQPIFTKLLREETDILRKHLEGSVDNEAFVQSSEHSQTQQVRLPGF
jgi:hypothetical protein